MGRAIIIICCGVVLCGSMAIDWLAPKPAPPPVTVRVIGAGVSRVPFLDEFGRVQFTAPYFAVTVGVKDMSALECVFDPGRNPESADGKLSVSISVGSRPG